MRTDTPATPSLGLGTASLGMPYGISRAGRPDAATAARIVETAFALGVRYVDTAAAYGDAETIVGRVLRRSRPAGLHICTKLPPLGPGLGDRELEAAVRGTVDTSRERLGVEEIDELLIHSAGDLREYGGRLVAVLEGLVRRRTVASLGVSIYEPDEARLAFEHPALRIVQAPFNVFDRRIVESGAAGLLRRTGRRLCARSVLLQGLLALSPSDAARAVPGADPWVAAFQRTCEEHGVSLLTAAVGFARVESGADVLVLGVETEAQLQDLVVAMRFEPDPAFIELLRTRCAGVADPVRDPRVWPQDG